MESAITVKNQATIPKSICEHLGLRQGDRVKFFVHPGGSVVLIAETLRFNSAWNDQVSDSAA